jgi:hypothetical protein
LQQLARLIPEVGRAVESVNSFNNKIQTNFSGSPFLTQTDILAAIPGKLTEYLIVRYLEDYHPTIFAALFLTGMIDLEDIEEAPTPFHVPYRKRTVNWNAIPNLFSDPLGSLKSNIDDGDEILYDRVLYLLNQLGLALGLLPIITAADPDVLDALNNGADLSDLEAAGDLDVLYFPVISDPTLGVGFDVYPLVDAITKKYTGVAMGLRAGAVLDIPLTEAYHLAITVSANAKDGLGLRIPRTGNPTFVSSLFTSPADLADAVTFGLRFAILPTELGPADARAETAKAEVLAYGTVKLRFVDGKLAGFEGRPAR